MKPASLLRVVLVFFALGFSGVTIAAENLGAVKARMNQRLGAVDALKERGVVGENNQGFLEARASGADQKVIAEENADRRTVYADIAAKTGSSPDAVGRQRAQQIASIAKRGVWVQDASGAWRQK